MAKATNSSQSVKKLAWLLTDIPIAMFTTATRGGVLRSRPMAMQQKDFDGDLWFFSDKDSAKIHEIGSDKHVNVTLSDVKKSTYISVSGMASLVKDPNRARGLWNPAAQAWYPKGPTDPKLVLIKVTVTQAEYWDAPSSKMVQLYEYAKAIVRGRRPKDSEFGENKKITLRKSASRKSASRRPRAASSRR